MSTPPQPAYTTTPTNTKMANNLIARSAVYLIAQSAIVVVAMIIGRAVPFYNNVEDYVTQGSAFPNAVQFAYYGLWTLAALTLGHLVMSNWMCKGFAVKLPFAIPGIPAARPAGVIPMP